MNTNASGDDILNSLLKWVERVRNAAFNTIQPISLSLNLMPDRADAVLVDKKEYESLRKLRDTVFDTWDLK